MDLTLIYYTANRIDYAFMHAVRAELFKCFCGDDWDDPVNIAKCPPIVTVTQKPDQWGRNICVGNIGASIYNVYRQVLIGARAAQTEFVACCEDDTLYAPSHFAYRSAPDTFAYDRSRWVITRRLSDDGKRREAFFYWRERTQMAMCIAPRALLIETLEEKFAKYPVPPVSTDVAKRAGWGEPGRYEKNLGLTLRKREYFDSPEPSITFNHSDSLMGRRKVNKDDIICTDLPPWGNANDLWMRIHG